MAKDDEDAPETDASAETAEETKQGFVKKLLGDRKLLMIAAGGVLLVVLGGGAAAYFFLFSASPTPKDETVAAIPATPPQVSFYDVPDILVNVQSADGTPAYLKLSLALELDAEAEKPGIQVLMPRMIDQFQSYLRELRLDDLKGSAGVLRLKEELLRRVNVAAAPYHIRDVLLKEMIVQ